MKNVLVKLQLVQSELKAGKDCFNSFGKYKYRNAEKLLTEIKPLLDKHKLVLTLQEEVVNMGNHNYIKSIATLYDLESDDTLVNTSFAKEDEKAAGMSASQMSGCSISYSRKYNLGGLFLFDDGVDADSNYTSSDNNPQPQQQKDYKSMSKEEKINNIKIQVSTTNTIDGLNTLWGRIGKWTENTEIKQAFTAQKNKLQGTGV